MRQFFYYYFLPDINFNWFCLIKNISFPKNVINLYIFYILNQQLRNWNTDFTINKCWFESLEPTKNADLDEYKFSSCGIGFDSRLEFLFTDGSLGKNVIIFGADMGSSVYNKGQDIVILGEGLTQGLDDTTLTAEAEYPINFKKSSKRFVLSLHFNGSNSLLFVNATKLHQFKAKDSEKNIMHRV